MNRRPTAHFYGFFFTLSTAFISTWTSPAVAQDQISCASNFGNPVELDKNSFHLAPATADEIAKGTKAEPVLSAGPFPTGQFAYDRVEIYLVQTKQGEEESVEATLSIYMRAFRAKKESWL